MKQCNQCKTFKEPTEFSKRSASRDGLQPSCKVCNQKDNDKFREKKPLYKKEWDKANPGAQTQIVKNYYHRNPVRYRSKLDAYYSKMGMGVYRITCNITQDFYVGYSSQLQARYNIYLRGSKSKSYYVNKKLWDDMLTYGDDNFTFEVLERVEDKSLLKEREAYWTKKLNPTYNVTNKSK